MIRGKKGKSQLMGGIVLLTLGCLFVLDSLFILGLLTSWPLLLVVIGLGLFLLNRRTLAGWIIGGIGVILFVVYFAKSFFPEVEAWTDLVWPIILIIVGVLLLYRYYHSGLESKP